MTENPNLLLIWTDQQRPDTLRCYGNDIVDAPHLNNLADQSIIFRDPYCVQPVCTPSRGTIMTGLWPRDHGARSNNIPLRREARTIAEMVSENYRTAYFGKWHLGDEVFAQHGFDEWTSIEDNYLEHYSDPASRGTRSSYHRFLVKNGFAPDAERAGQRVFSRNFSAAMAEPYTKAGFLGEEVSRYLRNYDREKPFLISVNFLEPHPPMFGPLNNRYDPDSLSLPETFGEPPTPDIQWKARMRAEGFRTEGFKDHPLNNDWDWRRLKANYYGLVTMVDNAVGHMLEALEESGNAENTIVAFTSDHGEMLGEHSLFKKGILYEGAVRVPMILRVPWLTSEQKMIEGRFSHIDLVPTLLDLMNQPVGDHLPGRSRVPVLRGEETLVDDDIFIQWNEKTSPTHECRAIITADGWKLCLFCEDQSMLFDLNADPHERRNLFKSEDHRGLIRDLSTRIRAWQQEIGDSLELPEV